MIYIFIFNQFITYGLLSFININTYLTPLHLNYKTFPSLKKVTLFSFPVKLSQNLTLPIKLNFSSS